MSDSKVTVDAKAAARKKTPVKTPEEWISDTRVLLKNAQGDADIAAALVRFGYDSARIAAGVALSDELAALSLRQKAEYGQRYDATGASAEAWRKASDAYMTALKVARIALRDRAGPRSAMMVDGPRNNSHSGWIQQAEAFYGNLLADKEAQADMARFGYKLESLQLEQGLVKDLSDKLAASRKEWGEAQGFTRERDRKLDELAHWVSDFRAICKLAFKAAPDKLKILGI